MRATQEVRVEGCGLALGSFVSEIRVGSRGAGCAEPRTLESRAMPEAGCSQFGWSTRGLDRKVRAEVDDVGGGLSGLRSDKNEGRDLKGQCSPQGWEGC